MAIYVQSLSVAKVPSFLYFFMTFAKLFQIGTHLKMHDIQMRKPLFIKLRFNHRMFQESDK